MCYLAYVPTYMFCLAHVCTCKFCLAYVSTCVFCLAYVPTYTFCLASVLANHEPECCKLALSLDSWLTCEACLC